MGASQKAVRAHGRGHRRGELRVKKPRASILQAYVCKSRGRATGCPCEVKEFQGAVIIASGWRRGGARWEVHARQVIRGIEATGNMHHREFELRNRVQPASLVMA